MGNQQPNGKKDDKDKEKKKYEAPIPTRVGKKKRVKVIFHGKVGCGHRRYTASNEIRAK